jgi:hypothetical protein
MLFFLLEEKALGELFLCLMFFFAPVISSDVEIELEKERPPKIPEALDDLEEEFKKDYLISDR